MSAPARAWLTAVSASRTRAASLSTRAVRRQRAAVAVVGVLAQARVGDRHERQLERADPRGTPPGRSRRRPTPPSPAGPCRRAGRTGARRRRPARPAGPLPRRRRRATGAPRRASTRSARGRPRPGRTKRGATSIDGWSRVSRTSDAQGRRPAQAAQARRSGCASGDVGRGRRGWASRSRVIDWSPREWARGRSGREAPRPRSPRSPRDRASAEVAPRESRHSAATGRLRPDADRREWRGSSRRSIRASSTSPRTAEPLVRTTRSDRAVRRAPRAGAARDVAGASTVR